jgi:hypothetical protein
MGFTPFHDIIVESKRLNKFIHKNSISLQEAVLSAKKRAGMPKKEFAIVDSTGKPRLPIHDAKHVKAAASYGISRIQGLSPAEKTKAAMKIKRKATQLGLNTPALGKYRDNK